jgi:hypothetical protein
VVGRGQRRFFAEADHELGAIAAELDRERAARFERIEQPAVGERQRDADVNAERFSCETGFFEPHMGTWREGRRLAVSEVDDPDAIALLRQSGERAADADLDVVRVGANGDHVERFGEFGHGVRRLARLRPALAGGAARGMALEPPGLAPGG